MYTLQDHAPDSVPPSRKLKRNIEKKIFTYCKPKRVIAEVRYKKAKVPRTQNTRTKKKDVVIQGKQYTKLGIGSQATRHRLSEFILWQISSVRAKFHDSMDRGKMYLNLSVLAYKGVAFRNETAHGNCGKISTALDIWTGHFTIHGLSERTG